MAEKSTEKTKKPRGEKRMQATAQRPNTIVLVLGIVALAALAASGLYYFGDRLGLTKDSEVSGVLAPGPLPDMALGSSSAPYTIIEYASMTCPHCAEFQEAVLPEVKTKYIDTGKARYIFREFPLDPLAAAASMLARCSGDERFFAMIDALFSTQKSWAVPGAEGKDKLLQVARQAGISKEQFDKCLADKELLDKIVEIRRRANEDYGVDSTPSFFVNGKKLEGAHEIEDFDAALGQKPASAPQDQAGSAGETPSPGE
jgi:protein-disulfide isomerase